VVAEGVASSISGWLAVLLAATVILVGAAVALVSRAARRVVPLVLALAASAITFGIMAVAGISLTLASIAVLPVLCGLVAGYAVLLRSRGRDGVVPDVTTGALTAVGFFVLVLSPVPMVREFGVMVVVGLVVGFALALTAGIALLRLPFPSIRPPRRISGRRLRIPGRVRRVVPLTRRLARGALDRAVGHPRRTLWIALGVAVLGWVAGTQVDPVTRLTSLAPSDQREVRDARTVADASGSSGPVSVLVHGRNLATPSAITWMSSYQRRVLSLHGYRDDRPCHQADLCPALSITNLFAAGPPRSEQQARAVLASLPRYFLQNLITADRRTANLTFGIRDMSVGRQKKVIDDMRSQLRPPKGITADLAGAPVLEADTSADLGTSRWTLALAAMLLVFGLLLALHRRFETAIVPLVPAVLATGWAFLILFLLPVGLSPLCATLAAPVLALCSGFGAILGARYRRERTGGLAPRAAIGRAYSNEGPSLLALGTTTVAGFAALIVSNVPMLRDFGLAAVLDLVVGLLGVAVVLPAVLVLAEEGITLRVPDPRLGLAAAGRALRTAGTQMRRATPGARRRPATKRPGAETPRK
jgi:predicted RND superfamily exporter protein